MTRATDDVFDSLHALTAETLITEINAYRNAVDAEGKPAPQAVPPALLAQALKFMKDNGIDAPARAKRVDDELHGKLPDLDEVDAEHYRSHH